MNDSQNKPILFSDWLNFQDKQRKATDIADKFDYVLYGGAAGGGKSYWLRKNLIRLLIKYYKQSGITNIVAGLFCEDYPSLKDRHLSKIAVEFPDWLGTSHADHKSYGNCYILHKEWGAGVLVFRNLDDPSKYKSSEFAIIAVDELTRNSEEKFHLLRSRMRWAGFDEHQMRTKFIAGTNPGEIGHAWVKKIWIDNDFSSELQAIKHTFAYIPATVDDNRYVGQQYIDGLDSLPEKMRRALREGNWDVFEGQYFTEWDRDKHIVEPFAIPPSWKRFRAYDHGRRNAACCLWFALDYDGRLWCYREAYLIGKDVDEIATEIVRLSQGEEYMYSVADPAIFSNIGFTDKYGGQTIAETFARYGIMWLPASNRRVDGWNLMHQYLRADEYSLPRLMFFSTVKNSIRTIPSLIHDDHKPEDVDSDGEDHAADTTRYMLMTLHERKTDKPLSDVEQKLERIKQQSNLSPMNFNNIFYGN